MEKRFESDLAKELARVIESKAASMKPAERKRAEAAEKQIVTRIRLARQHEKTSR